MAEMTTAQKRKMIAELRKASKLHAGQADRLEKTLSSKKKKGPTKGNKHGTKSTPMNVSAPCATSVSKSALQKALLSLST